MGYRNPTAAYYPDAKPESGFISKAYKQKSNLKDDMNAGDAR